MLLIANCRSPHALSRFGLGFAVWTLLGLFDAAHSYVQYCYDEDPPATWQILAMGLSLWYAWALLSILVFYLAKRFPFEPRHWLRFVLIHMLAAAYCACLKFVLDYPIIEAFYCPLPGLMNLVTQFMPMAFASHFHKYVVIYWAILFVAHAQDYYRRCYERELRASQLETKLSQAQLQLLRMQLHPHFLFNTLNAISALIHKDIEVADRMLARLGELLRLTLEQAGCQEVTLRQELEFVESYLEIEQVRFGERLTVEMKIDPEVMDALVPYLILQPMVENAIKHGIAPTAGSGSIGVFGGRVDDVLVLEVRNTGRPLAELSTSNRRQGIGVSNTRARLLQLYGDNQRFELKNCPTGGATATIEIPFCEESQSLAEPALLGPPSLIGNV